MGTIVIGAILGLPLLLSVVFFWKYLQNWDADRHVDRQSRATRLHPDRNGNYPVFYHPKTGMSYSPPPGNSPYPPYIYVYNGKPVEIKPDRRGDGITVITPYPITRDEPKNVVQQPFERPFTPEQLEQPEQNLLTAPPIGALPSGKTLEQVIEELRSAKETKQPLTKAIPAITLVTRGGGEPWNYWRQMWDEL